MLDFNLGVLTPSISCCKDEYPEIIYFQDYQNMCELDALFKEFDDKFSAYENLLALKDNITTYGYTPVVSDLIGVSEEGILESIGKGIGNFFKWLVDWCKRIYKFFTGALSRGGSSKNTVATMLSSPEQYKKLKEQIKLGKLESIEIPEKHTNISNSIGPIMKEFHDALKGPTAVFGGKDGDEIKGFEQELSRWINFVLRDKSTVAVNRQTAMKFIIPITDDTFLTYNKVVNMAEQLKKVSSINIPDKADHQEACQLIKHILEKLGMGSTSFGNIRRNINDKGDGFVDIERPILEDFKSYISSVNMLFRMFYRLFATVKQLGIRIFTQLCTNESAAKAAVFLRIKPPQHLVDKLRELWGYPKFNYKEVILTNMDRGHIRKHGKSLGHMISDDNPQSVWINVALFTNKDKFAELVDISKNTASIASKVGVPHVYSVPEKYTTAFIETLVHESRHVVQYQAKMDCVATDEENQKDYYLRLKEIDARKMAHEYVTKYLTEEDTAWAKKVISQAIAQEIKHVKQYRPDAESK